MDFDSILQTAAKNAQNIDKKVESIKREVEDVKRRDLQRLENEKREKQRLIQKMKDQRPKKEPTPERKFVIPKKKPAEANVSKDQIAKFLAKKEEAKKNSDKQKKADKDKLIQLRMQSNGGKANNKMAKQFGIDPISMQIRYGNDTSHIERLQKQKWREEEELDSLSTQFRSGVYKAKQEMGKKLQEMASSSGIKKEPHRVATSKANSLAGLSSRHGATRDHFSPPKETKKEVPKSVPSTQEKKKRPSAPPVKFETLMKVATEKTAGKNVDLSVLGPTPSKVPKMSHDRNSKETNGKNGNSLSHKTPSSSHNFASNSFKKPVSSTQTMRRPSIDKNNSISSVKKPSNGSNNKPPSDSKNVSDKSNEKTKEKKDAKGRFVKGPTPPPAIPNAVLGKRYLPGDVRYKQQQQMMKAAGIKEEPRSSTNSSSHANSIQKQTNSLASKANRGAFDKRPSSSSTYASSSSGIRPGSSQSSKQSRDHISKEESEKRRRALERKRYEKRRYEEMSLVERERERERKRALESYGFEEDDFDDEDDDEYDSEMDDFIDDSMDVEMSREDFEETLKMVNPKYDKKVWKYRESKINERDMESNYRTMQREEARSTRLGFLEDVYEAKKHNSKALC